MRPERENRASLHHPNPRKTGVSQRRLAGIFLDGQREPEEYKKLGSPEIKPPNFER